MNDYDNYKEYEELKEEQEHRQFMNEYLAHYDRIHGYDD